MYVRTYVSVVICTHLNYVCTTAPPMTAPNIIGTTPLSSTSFTVSWTITDPDHNYIITWTNLRTGMISGVTVPENTNSYTVTGLNGIDNYIVTVTANDSCGMMALSDPITVYGKNVYIHSYVCIYMYVCVPVAVEAGQELPPTFIIQGRVLPKLRKSV